MRERSPSLSTVTPSGSPPSAYTTAVPIDPALHNSRFDTSRYVFTEQATDFTHPADHQTTSTFKNDKARAYRYEFDGLTVPELAGDAVPLSGTNPGRAGAEKIH